MSDIINAPGALARPKPEAAQVGATFSSEVAARGVSPAAVIMNQAGDNSAQALASLSAIEQRNMAALASLSPALSEKLNQAQEERFQDGYMRALQGNSVASIAKDDGIKQIFGDGAAVRGARAAQAQSAVNALDQYVQQNAGDLSRMTLDEQRAVVGKFVAGMSTGDDAADSMIAQQTMQRLPAIFDQLTRGAVQENQRQAAVAQADTIKSYGETLAAAGRAFVSGNMSAEHFETYKIQAAESLKPMPGQTTGAWLEAMNGAAAEHARQGNFEMAGLISEATGRVATPAEQATISRSLEAGRADYLKNNPESRNYAEWMQTAPTQIAAGRYSTRADLEKTIDYLNDDQSVKTGGLSPFIDNDQRGQLLAQWDRWDEQQAKLGATADAKLMDEQMKADAYKVALSNGSPSAMKASGVDARTKLTIDQQTSREFIGDHPGAATIVSRLASQGQTLQPLKEYTDKIVGRISEGSIPAPDELANFRHAFNNLRQQGYAALDTYFGDKLELAQYAAEMELTPENMTNLRRKAETQRTKAQIPVGDLIQAEKDVKDLMNPGWWSRTLGGRQNFGYGAQLQITTEATTEYAQLAKQYPNLAQADLLDMAYARTMKTKDVVGDYVVNNSQAGTLLGEMNKSLDFPITDERDGRLNETLSTLVTTKAPGFEAGGSITTYGNGTYVMDVRNGDVTRQLFFRPDDLTAIMNEKRRGAVKAKKDVAVAEDTKKKQAAQQQVEWAKYQAQKNK
ncbi:hypothetical protein [Aeromonas phage phiA014L]|uniref:Internal virion protein C n=1 Tax=Aeromonas phage phiA014L TaxID=3119844 RepID=A0ABZ2CLQ9_9CAUD